MPEPNRKTKVMLSCVGLGIVNRGVEAFTRECFDVLQRAPNLDLVLYKGGGQPAANEWVLPPPLPTESAAARIGGALTRKDPTMFSHASFGLKLLKHIEQEAPDVLFTGERVVGHIVWRWRKRVRNKVRLLMFNGSPVAPPFPHWDHVQQLTQPYYEDALRAGEPTDRVSLVPIGQPIASRFAPLSPNDKAALRAKLGLPTDRRLVLSVGALNTWHKRMDYTVREVAGLPAHLRPFLLLLGQTEKDTPQITQFAQESLGEGNWAARTVPLADVPQFYQAADVFVLSSLTEGFGKVYVEALGAGLPTLAHDTPNTRYIIGDPTALADFTQTGSLTRLLTRFLDGTVPLEGAAAAQAAVARHQWAYEKFSWDALFDDYVRMIHACAQSEQR